ncbi:MAG: hypothetical protein PHS49_05900 [Candidatus Gracilibacteria bacterium]|nr:hypothetical protein [Candidatus Gracilibacteria bacterium]
MKKLSLFIVFLFMCSYTYSTNASSILLESTQNFYPSQGIVESRVLNIQIDSFVNSGNYFTLLLPNDSNIRFSEDFSNVIFTGNSSSKIGSGITIMPDLKHIKFELKENFEDGDSFSISGLKLKIYSKPQGDRYIGLDLNGDMQSDASSSNGYRVLDVYAYSDTLAPSEVFNFTGSVVDNKITVSADMPGDLDFQALVLENLDKDGNVLSSFFRYDLDNFSYDLQANYDSIRIKTVDTRANYSKGLVFGFDIFKAKIDENVVEEPILVDEPVIEETEVVIDIIEKYVPKFTVQERLLNKVVKFIDDYIDKTITNEKFEANRSNIYLARNKLVLELEILDTATKAEKPAIVQNVRAYFKELALELKK